MRPTVSETSSSLPPQSRGGLDRRFLVGSLAVGAASGFIGGGCAGVVEYRVLMGTDLGAGQLVDLVLIYGFYWLLAAGPAP